MIFFLGLLPQPILAGTIQPIVGLSNSYIRAQVDGSKSDFRALLTLARTTSMCPWKAT